MMLAVGFGLAVVLCLCVVSLSGCYLCVCIGVVIWVLRVIVVLCFCGLLGCSCIFLVRLPVCFGLGGFVLCCCWLCCGLGVKRLLFW